jgi:peptide/nickel transport system permease protein
MSLATSSVVAAPVPEPEPTSIWAARASALWGHALGRVGLSVVATLVLAALLAGVLAPHDPNEIYYNFILAEPGRQFWFGTDELGRDIFGRILYGARVSLMVVGAAVILSLVVGSTIGLVSGYFGGAVDEVIMRVMDGLMAFPALVLALAIVAVLGPDLVNAMIAIAIVNVPGFARLVRGETLVVRELDFVQAARAMGASRWRIMARHIWPSVSGNVLVYASLKASTALITESALSFLGLGVQPPTPSWGYMLATGMQYSQAWWISVFPGAVIFITVLGLNLCGDALRDVIDPKLNPEPSRSNRRAGRRPVRLRQLRQPRRGRRARVGLISPAVIRAGPSRRAWRPAADVGRKPNALVIVSNICILDQILSEVHRQDLITHCTQGDRYAVRRRNLP